MAAASIVPMDDLPQEKPSEDIVEQLPPSYQLLFGTPNTSENVQCQQPKSIVMTGNDQCRQLIVMIQPTSDQPIYCIKSHLAWSILNMIFCCCLCGCVAWCFSMKTEKLKNEGDTQGALKASKTAKSWNTISTIVGTVFITIRIIQYVGIASHKYSV